MMYVYLNSEHGLWTVGFYRPDGKWEPESDHPSSDAAAARVAFLNGGGYPPLPDPLPPPPPPPPPPPRWRAKDTGSPPECYTEHDWEFCETHQLGFCPRCESTCPECRRDRALGEPTDDDEDADGDA